jgi:Sec-independent protein translocase protein TatA
MQLFGIGPLELLFILVIMILVLGPKGMVRAAHETGKFIRKVTRSPLWAEIVGTSREIRNLPAKIIKEAGIEKEVEELRRSTLPPTFPQDDYFLHPPDELSADKQIKVISRKRASKKTLIAPQKSVSNIPPSKKTARKKP